jgi:hypothetical protein
MNKLSKSLIVLFLAFLLGGCFSVDSVQAQDDKLILEVTKECDFQYSGDICIAELKLTNNTGKVLDGEASLHIDYKGMCSNNELKNFDGEGIHAWYNDSSSDSDWNNGEITFSGFEITKGETQSKLKIETVPNLCPDEYTFNLKLKGTIEEEEYIAPLVVIGGGGGGGGSFIASGLTISNETVLSVGINTITITWNTNLNSTSRVIYSPQGFPHLLQVNNPPNYGYVFSTDEDSSKVIKHAVIITGLTSGTTYYYRTVSHASPDTISREYSFITLGEKEVQTEEKTETGAETEEGGIVLGEKTEKREQEIKEITEEERGGVEEEQGQVSEEQKEEKTEVESKQELPLLAAVGNILSFGTGNVWIAIIIGIIILALLIFIVFRITKRAKRGKFEKNLKK